MTDFLQGENDGLADGDRDHCDCAMCHAASAVLLGDFHKESRRKVKKCPECRAGKCQNCDGIADLDDDDNPVVCECDSDDPHPLRVDILEFEGDDDDDDRHDSKWLDD